MSDKKMCKLAKDKLDQKALKKLKAELKDPTHICKRCLRVSSSASRLCKAEKLDD